MTPHIQLIRHDPENGLFGDCFRTVIACLLDMPPADVPHVYDAGATSDTARPVIDAWLMERGLCLISIVFPGDDLDQAMTTMKFLNPGVYYMLSGFSRTGCNHVVVCLDDKIVHDPSPAGAGIVGPVKEDGLYWFSFIGHSVCRSVLTYCEGAADTATGPC